MGDIVTDRKDAELARERARANELEIMLVGLCRRIDARAAVAGLQVDHGPRPTFAGDAGWVAADPHLTAWWDARKAAETAAREAEERRRAEQQKAQFAQRKAELNNAKRQVYVLEEQLAGRDGRVWWQVTTADPQGRGTSRDGTFQRLADAKAAARLESVGGKAEVRLMPLGLEWVAFENGVKTS